MWKIVKNNLLFFVGVFLLLYFLFSISFSKLGKWFNPDDYSTKADDSKSTITDFKAEILADSLHVAMGTDFFRIKQVLNGLTIHDFAKVHNKFGTRGYIDFIGVGTDLPMSLKLNLTQWFESELTHEQFRELKTLYPSIF